jgi:hypothetical protein
MRLIDENAVVYGVAPTYAALGVARATYYRRRRPKPPLLTSGGTREAAAFAGSVELGIPRRPDGRSASREEVGGGDVTDGAVQADGVVVLDEAGDQGASLLERVGLAGDGSRRL